MTVDAAVVVCAYVGDEPVLTLRCLKLAAMQAPGRTHLIDMSPAPDAVADPAREIEGVVVHHVPESRGLGESRQLGLMAASERYVAFLDSDAMPRPGWLAALRAAAEPADVAVAGGPVLPVWPAGRRPRLFETSTAGDYLSMLDLGDRPLDVPRVLPGNMLVDRELTGADVFATTLGRTGADLLGAEEIAMMLRVVGEGKRIIYAPAAVVDHHSRGERMRWRWMWRRAYAAGRETAHMTLRLEPVPRPLQFADWAFLAAIAPAYLAGAVVERDRIGRKRRA